MGDIMKLKEKYKTIMDDNFPETLEINFGGQRLLYKKEHGKFLTKKKACMWKRA